MKSIIQIIIKTLGVGWLLRQAYKAVRPMMVQWAESDGEDDWDDDLVRVVDVIIEAIAGKIEEQK